MAETDKRSEKKHSYPDQESQLMTLYGSSYTEVTLRTAQIDEIIKVLTAAKAEIEDGLDPQAAIWILDRPHLIRPSAELPEMDSVMESTLLMVRRLITIDKSLVLMNELRNKVIRYGRVEGAKEHSEERQKKGISQEEWQRAALYYEDKHPMGGRP